MHIRGLITKTQKMALFGAVIFFTGVASFITIGNRLAAAGDTSPNAIMNGGASSPTDFIAKLKANQPGDLPAIYAGYSGLGANDYDRFASQAKLGTLSKDSGNVTVDGKLVATAHTSIGRSAKPYAQPITIGGRTYYESKSTDVMQSNTTVMVMFDASGKAGVIIINDCGNPVKFTPILPATAECRQLTVAETANRNERIFTTTAALSGTDVSVNGYNYVIKNSSGQIVDSAAVDGNGLTNTYKATVTTPGTYTVQAGVRTSLGTKISDACIATFTTAPAPTPTPPTPAPQPQVPAITIQKLVDGVKTKQVETGKNFTYAITVKNTGQVDLNNITVTDTLPPNITFHNAETGNFANGKWAATIAQLKIGASQTLNLTAQVPQYQAGNLTNTACVNAPDVNPAQPAKDDACDTASVTVTSPLLPPPTPPTPKNAAVSIQKTVNDQENIQVSAGQEFTYKIVVKNIGDSDLVNAVVTDPAIAGLSLVRADRGAIDANGSWTYSNVTLRPGETVTALITAKVSASTATTITNSACVNAAEVNPADIQRNDACDTAVISVAAPVTTAAAPVTPAPAVKAATTTTAVLPNTGAGAIVGLVAVTIIGTMIGYRLFLNHILIR